MKLKKSFRKLLVFCSIVIVIFILFFKDGLILDFIGIHWEFPIGKEVQVPNEYSMVDLNQNGIADPLDIVDAARKEVTQRTFYKSAYYDGGYPPDDEGVCTDVIWRGLLGADIPLKELMDKDIADHTNLYPRVNGNPDPNIDFRRVPNQNVFFSRYAKGLTTEFIKGDPDNLKKWQPGDIVVYLDGFHHVGIISDKRTRRGVPYLIHNTHPFAAEVKLTSLKTPIAGHYRWEFD